jgi:branched-chain amino acid transport system ATP-binding protein
VLTLDAVHVHLGRSHVLQGVSFCAAPTEVTALIGRNGVGKSTTLRAIIGLIRPTLGHVRWNESDLTTLSTNRIVQQGLGWIPEHRGNFRTLTVRENLRVSYGGPRAEWDARESYVYGLFPILRERRAQRAGSLSGGEQQMLAIAKALVTPRRFLLLDEPTQGLSPRIVEVLLETLTTLKRAGIGLLLVEQNLEAALAVSDRVLVMEKGVIKLDEPRRTVDLARLIDLLGARVPDAGTR